MEKKVLKVVSLVVLGVLMLVLLTGCGDTPLIKELKQSEFIFWGDETGYTWDQATKAVMSGVKWTEYTENDQDFVMISGVEKETGKYVEIIYKVYSGGDLARYAVNVDGDRNNTYFDTMFRDLSETYAN